MPAIKKEQIAIKSLNCSFLPNPYYSYFFSPDKVRSVQINPPNRQYPELDDLFTGQFH